MTDQNDQVETEDQTIGEETGGEVVEQPKKLPYWSVAYLIGSALQEEFDLDDSHMRILATIRGQYVVENEHKIHMLCEYLTDMGFPPHPQLPQVAARMVVLLKALGYEPKPVVVKGRQKVTMKMLQDLQAWGKEHLFQMLVPMLLEVPAIQIKSMSVSDFYRLVVAKYGKDFEFYLEDAYYRLMGTL